MVVRIVSPTFFAAAKEGEASASGEAGEPGEMVTPEVRRSSACTLYVSREVVGRFPVSVRRDPTSVAGRRIFSSAISNVHRCFLSSHRTQVDAEMVKQLGEMGFNANRAARAIYNTGSNSLEVCSRAETAALASLSPPSPDRYKLRPRARRDTRPQSRRPCARRRASTGSSSTGRTRTSTSRCSCRRAPSCEHPHPRYTLLLLLLHRGVLIGRSCRDVPLRLFAVTCGPRVRPGPHRSGPARPAEAP